MNRLASESSPYLVQHAENPVDWYPWGEEALERARSEDKPILLSIGYAACHWCHVMAHESFEDEATARLMNELFVNIKVDREERPDLDGIYMQATQAMTGHGGWPMTVFLTPETAPFYTGTYFPPQDRQGMPSFRRVLLAVADAYKNRRGSVDETAAKMRELYANAALPTSATGQLTAQTLDRAYRQVAQGYDQRNGGFGGAPKFPQTMTLDFLLRYSRRTGTDLALDMVATSFRKMARGGIYDHLGGGFHRYAVDAVWLVPHFEKMLYDNALLARLGAHVWQATHDPEFRRVTEETVDWVAREMTSPVGGFYSSLDADSEGHEGTFYIWTREEVERALGGDGALAAAYWGVSQDPNFEGKYILYAPHEVGVVAARAGVTVDDVTESVANARKLLLARRARRVRPGRDEKVLAAWNGLMLRGVVEAARAFSRDDYRVLAVRNGEFLLREMVRNGRVMRTHTAGVTRIPGFLEDHAAVALGLLDLYSLTFDERWLSAAKEIASAMDSWFWDEPAGAWFDTASDHEALLTRPREVTDNAVPSGTSLAIDVDLRLAELLGDSARRERAMRVLESLAEPLTRYASAFGHALGVADMAVHGAIEVALAGDPSAEDFQALAEAVADSYAPSLIVAGGAGSTTALMADKVARDGHATAYICRQYRCDEPTSDPAVLARQIEHAARSPLGAGA
ncbi:MAG TPA: thioredoxin domain-containing protein [Gemmatimonadaceae bacterium]|nr:thioredoxin domain-containing protein [Gemmatimonadaceae bacterium]